MDIPGNKRLLVVLYDGITKSSFQSQVLAPLMQQLENAPTLEITLVSFEGKAIQPEKLIRIIPAHRALHVVIMRRLPFLGKFSLWFSALQLTSLLAKQNFHQVQARGAFAGWIAQKALGRLAHKFPERLRADALLKMPSFMVQARGLAAEEYRYSYMRGPSFMFVKWFNIFVYNMLKNIESEVYRNKRKSDYPHDVRIEAVTAALKDYLVKNFRADETKIILAVNDLPRSVDKETVTQWRSEIREKLCIAPEAYVYCFNGAYRPWQCPEETVAFFGYQRTQNQNIFLLVLTHDTKAFINALDSLKIPANTYLVLDVPAHEVLKYLAAGDAGIVLRESDVISWVSRPNKMLEYQALGLKIIHNNTIAWLAQAAQ
jgi:hypothetical protein